MKSITVLFIAVFLGLQSCGTNISKYENQKKEGHWRLYSHPDEDNVKTDEKVKRIVVVGTNSFEGKFSRTYGTIPTEKEGINKNIPIGGEEVVKKYLDRVKEVYDKKLLLVDAGNSFGKLDTKSSSEFFMNQKYTALTLGDSDIQSKKNLLAMFSESKIPFLTANLIDVTTGEVLDGKNNYPFIVRNINGVKVGIIGLLTSKVPTLEGLYIEKLTKTAIKFGRKAEKSGAEVLVLVTSADMNCGKEIADKYDLPLSKVNFNPLDSSSCESNGELYRVLQKLPHGFFHAVVSSNSKSKISNIINGMPVIHSFGNGKSFSRVELFYDTEEKKVLTDKTIVHQPTYFCHYFFKETDDCYWEDQSINHQITVPARFLGKEI